MRRRTTLIAAINATIVLATASVASEKQAAFAQAFPPPPAICDPLSVFFGSQTATLNAEALQVISEAALIVMRRQGRAYVTGHTDGAELNSRELSEARAEAVKQEMVRQGISAQRVEIEGAGFSVPLLPTAIGIAEPLNRRAVIVMPCEN